MVFAASQREKTFQQTYFHSFILYRIYIVHSHRIMLPGAFIRKVVFALFVADKAIVDEQKKTKEVLVLSSGMTDKW